jgi:hypothetical protein
LIETKAVPSFQSSSVTHEAPDSNTAAALVGDLANQIPLQYMNAGQKQIHDLRYLQQTAPTNYNLVDDDQEVKPEMSYGRPQQYWPSYDYAQPSMNLHGSYASNFAPPQQHPDQPPAKRARQSAPIRRQEDGEFDDDDDDFEDDDDVRPVVKQHKEGDLNSDDDISDDEADVPATSHIVLSQFEKVSRTKNKWKCALKCGIMHLNGQDYVFNRATGEFDW